MTAMRTIKAIGGLTPLIVAARNGRKDIVDALVTSGANVDGQLDPIEPNKCACAQFMEYCSLTFDACYAPLTALAAASESGHYDVVDALIGHGTDVDLSIEHHAHGRLLTRRENRRRKIPEFGRSSSPESSDTDPESDLHQWKGYFSVGTALTWARRDVRELLLRHVADPSREVAMRQCDCQVIKERETKGCWMGRSSNGYVTSDGTDFEEEVPQQQCQRSSITSEESNSISDS